MYLLITFKAALHLFIFPNRRGRPQLQAASSFILWRRSRKLHLHARSLTIQHPITKEMLTFTAPLPDHMAKTWKLLDWNEKDVPADPFEMRR